MARLWFPYEMHFTAVFVVFARLAIGNRRVCSKSNFHANLNTRCPMHNCKCFIVTREQKYKLQYQNIWQIRKFKEKLTYVVNKKISKLK